MTARSRRREAIAEPRMYDVRAVREPDARKSRRIAEALRFAVEYAQDGTKLPEYLAKAALRFDAQMQRAIDIVLVLRLVQKAASEGKPLNRTASNGGESAFDVVAERLGLGAEAVQKIYYGNNGKALEQFPARPKTRKKPR